MIGAYVNEIQRMRDEGGIVLIKWDGERAQLCQTVMVNTGYVWRKDCDDIESGLRAAIAAYNLALPH